MVISITFSILLIFVISLFVSFSVNGRQQWYSQGMVPVVILGLFVLFGTVFSPLGSDKIRYLSDFVYIEFNNFDKDIGWFYLTKILYDLTNGSTVAYLFILAFSYLLGYCILGANYFGKDKLFYFILFSTLYMGFWSGGTNIMRAGLATSFFFISLAYKDRIGIYLLFSLLAVSIHGSLLVLVVGFLVTKYYCNYRTFYYIWICFVVLSAANVLGGVTDFLSSHLGGEVGERLADYAYVDSDNEVYELYTNAGFRVDFIIYSAFPLLYAWWMMEKRGYNDYFFERLVCTYIMANCLWLVMIRVPYADRFALLSWSLMCFIMLYPYLHKDEAIEYDSKGVCAVMIPVLVNVALLLR